MSTAAWCLYRTAVSSRPSGPVKVSVSGFSVIATLFERLEGHVGGGDGVGKERVFREGVCL